MKRSHLTTPRNLGDCDFTVGYPSVERGRLRGIAGTLGSAAIIAALAVMIGYALAMMVPA
jgi:hypothetical protein